MEDHETTIGKLLKQLNRMEQNETQPPPTSLTPSPQIRKTRLQDILAQSTRSNQQDTKQIAPKPDGQTQKKKTT